MKLRKLISLGLMGTLGAAMVVPAFASNIAEIADGEKLEGETSSTTELEGIINIPTISVKLPTSGMVVLNPYELTYTDATSGLSGASQIVAAEGIIQNLTEAKIEVKCFPTISVSNKDIEVIEEQPAATADHTTQVNATKAVTDGKQLYMALNAEAVKQAAAPATFSTVPTVMTTAAVADADWESIPAIAVDKKDFSQPDDGTATTKQFLAYKIDGAMSKVNTWSDTDVVSASIAWSFAIAANQ